MDIDIQKGSDMTETGRSTLDEAAAVFAEARPRLFGIAYRMLGSVTDAEDLLQDVWVRWQTSDRSAVRSPAAYLTTITTRLAINATQSAYTRRESYVGPWLPEPIDITADPQLGAENAAALELAVLLLLEKLSPAERAAYVLREAFDYPYDQIAAIVQTTEVTARQHVSRARKRLSAERRAPVSSAQRRRLLNAFVSAAKVGDLSTLERLFAQDVVNYADSGGVLPNASLVPLHGADTVAKVVGALAHWFWADVEAEPAMVNGYPAMLLQRDGATFAVLSLSASADGIDQLMWIMNPDKLGSLSAPK